MLSDGDEDFQLEKENKNFPLKTKDELLLNVSTYIDCSENVPPLGFLHVPLMGCF